MKTLERLDEPVRPTDELTALQLRIARRADELARACGRTMSDWECWIEAERGVLDDAGGTATSLSW